MDRLRPIDYLLQEKAKSDPKLYEALKTISAAVFDLQGVVGDKLDSTTAIPNVTEVNVSEGPVIAADEHIVSRLTCSFKPPSDVLNWKEVEIYITGYQGSGKPLFVAAAAESPFTFDLEVTRELVRFHFVSLGVNGKLNEISESPFVDEILDGITSTPLVPSGFLVEQFVVGKSVVNRLTWDDSLEADLDHYDIARRTNANPPGNTDIISSHLAGTTSGSKEQFDDSPNPAATTFYYAVRAVSIMQSGTPSLTNPIYLKSAFTTPQAAQNLAPATPNVDFAGQILTTAPNMIRLSWTPNTESDMDHYEAALRFDATTPTDADQKFPVPHIAGTNKILWDHSPGSNSAQARYWVRAVDTLNNKSSFRGPATITSLAPDGTTDTGVPTQGFPPGASESTTLAANGIVEIPYTAPVSIGASYNMAGTRSVRFHIATKPTSGGGATTTHKFEDDFDPLLDTVFLFSIENQFLWQIIIFQRNYFGWSGGQTIYGPTSPPHPTIGSQAQDAKPPSANFDPSVQSYGATQITGKTGGDLVLTTVDAGGKVRAVKTITSDVGYQVSGAGGSAGQVLRSDGTKAIIAAIQFADLPTSVLNALIASKKISWGTAQLVSGTKLVTVSGMTTVDLVLITHVYGAAPTEYFSTNTPSGNQFTVYSSNIASGNYFFWLAIGS